MKLSSSQIDLLTTEVYTKLCEKVNNTKLTKEQFDIYEPIRLEIKRLEDEQSALRDKVNELVDKAWSFGELDGSANVEAFRYGDLERLPRWMKGNNTPSWSEIRRKISLASIFKGSNSDMNDFIESIIKEFEK